MRKVLAMILCLALVCTLMPTIAWADGETGGGDDEITVTGLYVSDNSSVDELTWETLNTGMSMTEDDAAYLYLYENEEVKPFSPAGEVYEQFYSYENQIIGDAVDEAPFLVGRMGSGQYVVYYTGGDTNTYAMSITDAEDNVYGYVVLIGQEGGNGETGGGDDGGTEETSLKILDAITDGNNIGGQKLNINTSLSPEDNAFYVRASEELTCSVEVYTHRKVNDDSDTTESEDSNVTMEDEENKGWETAESAANYVTMEVVEGNEDYWKVFVGKVEDNTEDDLGDNVEANAEGSTTKYHGLESLRLTFTDGTESAKLEVNMGIGVTYTASGVNKITDYRTILDEVLQEEAITLGSELQIIGESEDETEVTVLYEDFGMTTESGRIDNHVALNIKLNPGYSVKDILVNGTSAKYEATANYYYAPYDAEGTRIDASVDDRFSGCIAGYGNSALWINGNLRDSNDPLDELKREMEPFEGGRTELLASAIQYYVEIEDITSVNSVKIITAETVADESGNITATNKDGDDFAITAEPDNSAEDTAVRNTALGNLYKENTEVYEAYDIKVTEGELNGIVDVVIPVENASDYQLVWFCDDNTPVPVVATYTAENDAIIFPAGHFSVYALVQAAAGDDNEGGNTGGDDNTGSGDNEGGNTGDNEGGNAGGGNTGGSWYPVVPRDPNKAAKSEAEKAVTGYVDAAEYDAAEAEEIAAIIEQAKADIKAAKSAEEIKAIEEAVKAELDKLETAEEKAVIAEVEDTKFKARSQMTTLRGKRAVKITWEVPEGMDFDGFEVYRSTQRFKGFGKEPFFTTTKTTYTNNKDLKTGNTYYYKVKAFKYVNDEKVYTEYSFKAWRTIKK